MYNESELVKKETLKEMVRSRDEQAGIMLEIIRLAKKLQVCCNEISQKIKHPEFIRSDDIDDLRKAMDLHFWRKVFDDMQVEKFLTTIDKEKMMEAMEKDTPSFDISNVYNTVNSFIHSKEATALNLIKKVYENFTDMHFISSGSKVVEKRLQLGITKVVRASVFYTYGKCIPSYVSSTYSKFDHIIDLERACYLCDGKLQPDRLQSIEAIANKALNSKLDEFQNEYFHVKVYKNGNVKITFLDDEVLKTLNRWGKTGNRLTT